MKNSIKSKYSPIFFFCFACFLAYTGYAQRITAAWSDTLIHIYEPLLFSLSIENEELYRIGKLPYLAGFREGERFTETITEQTDQGAVVQHTLVQYYYPTRTGTFRLPAFQLHVNDTIIQVAGQQLRVVPAPEYMSEPEWYGLEQEDQVLAEASFNKQDIQLLLYLSKDTVFVGEEFHLTLSLLVSKELRVAYEFPDINKQMLSLAKQLSPMQCWIEDFTIHQLYAREVVFRKKRYDAYTLFSASFFPSQPGSIHIPSAALHFKKLLEADSSQLTWLSVYSDSAIVYVKPLPQHPLMKQVAVGVFFLDDKLYTDTDNLKTGEVIDYGIAIAGYGNLAALAAPQVIYTPDLEIYPGKWVQNIRRAGVRVFGTKLFRYRLLVRQAGSYELGRYFYFVYFNPQLGRYDTLRPRTQIKVEGAAVEDARMLAIRRAYESHRTSIPAYLKAPYALWKYHKTWFFILLILLFVVLLRVLLIVRAGRIQQK